MQKQQIKQLYHEAASGKTGKKGIIGIRMIQTPAIISKVRFFKDNYDCLQPFYSVFYNESNVKNIVRNVHEVYHVNFVYGHWLIVAPDVAYLYHLETAK